MIMTMMYNDDYVLEYDDYVDDAISSAKTLKLVPERLWWVTFNVELKHKIYCFDI